jgi:cell division transport system ATP-binding protein
MRYGSGPEVLRDVTFHLPPGSFHFVFGPSGAGKSTLLKLMYMAERPTRGVVMLFDRDPATAPRTELPALRRRIGVVSQDLHLLDHMSALDNAALPLRVAGARESEVRAHVEELLAWVGLEEQKEAKPPTLSEGERQRVAIARAVIARPRLLIADEPTGSVDTEQGRRLLYLFEELNKLGTTVVIATHDRSLVARTDRTVIKLVDGTLEIERGGVAVQAVGQGA